MDKKDSRCKSADVKISGEIERLAFSTVSDFYTITKSSGINEKKVLMKKLTRCIKKGIIHGKMP